VPCVSRVLCVGVSCVRCGCVVCDVGVCRVLCVCVSCELYGFVLFHVYGLSSAPFHYSCVWGEGGWGGKVVCVCVLVCL